MADKLTPQQEQAVFNRGGKLLVSAAAGSGKTKVLVDRLLSYLTDPDHPANLDEFLIITYTKAAASELRGKIAAKLTERIAQEPGNVHLQKQMQRLYLTNISTVHGFCGNVLREYAYRLDLPADFRVADENECAQLKETVLNDLLDKAYEHLGDNESFCAFVDSQGVGRNDGRIPEIIQKVYNSARCHLNPDAWLEECLTVSDMTGLSDAGETVWGRFLMEELFWYLDRQIECMSSCRDSAAFYPELKKVAVNLDSAVSQLRYLRNSATWNDVVARRKIDYGRLVFPKNNPDEGLAAEIKAVRDACKDRLERKLRPFADESEQILQDMQSAFKAANGLIALVKQFDSDYRQIKRSRRVLDFGDLEHKMLDLLLGKNRQSITAAANEIGSRFREVMVDEYQDSNSVQDAIFSALTAKQNNCFMVGDVKQSIYQFRLADPGIFLEKYNTFAPAESAESGQGRKVLLSHNFRSGGEVIEAVNDVFSVCMSERVGGLIYGESEALREGVPHVQMPDNAVEFYAIETGEDKNEDEAAFAASRIQQMLQSGTVIRRGDGFRPVQPEDIVILLRSPNSSGADYQKALERVGIRCAIDGGMDLLHMPEIETLHCILQTIANPRQDIPLLGAIASPVFGFTADDLAQIRGANKKGCIFDALEKSDHPKCGSFLNILDQLRKSARMEPLTQLIEKCLLLTRMDSIYGAMPGGKARMENIQMFYQLAADYEKTGLRSLDQFLEYLDSLKESGMASAGSSTAGCVTIMSIHKSKGLEFPVVFLCGLSRGFNQESLREQILCDKDLGLGLAAVDNKNRIRYSTLSKKAIAASMEISGVSEEMRVLYVAMTRAKDRLVMTYAAKKLENDVKDIALRISADGGMLLNADASCPGDWVLAAALQRTEAHALHNLGGKPRETKVHQYPWLIKMVTAPQQGEKVDISAENTSQKQSFSVEMLKEALSYQYPHEAATKAPSKQTATGRKGRSRDEEAQENTKPERHYTPSFRKPTFREVRKDGRAYGNAFHSAMQFIRFENCGNLESTETEIQRLVQEGYLSEEQGHMVDCEKIAAFFAGPIGSKLRNSASHIREFKFSILDDAVHYGENLEGEQVLLQGVVDCAILEEDGIILLDYKTDHVNEENVDRAADRHRQQLEIYAEALTKIYQKPVKEKYIYFFYLNRLYAI